MIDPEPSEPGDTLGTQLTLLSNPERRALLVALAETGDDRTTAYRPFDLLGRTETSERRRIELYHTHLPKLAANGLIRWDSDAGTIRRGPEWEEVTPLLELLVSHRGELPEGSL